MALIGFIPTTQDTVQKPYPLPCPIEMVPVETQVVRGEHFLKPVSQLAVEGMIAAGAIEKIVMVLAKGKESIMHYYGDGREFGIPISYVYGGETTLAGAINSAYDEIKDQTVLMSWPTLTLKHALYKVLEQHDTHPASITITVSQNTRLDQYDNIIDPPGSMTGGMAWEPEFTDFMRGIMAEIEEGNELPELSSLIKQAHHAGMIIRGVKLPYFPLMESGDLWQKTMTMLSAQRFADAVNEQD